MATFRCADCSDYFTSSKALAKHARVAKHNAFRCGEQNCMPESGGSYRCLAFPSEAALVDHISKVHGRQIKLFKCPVCIAAGRPPKAFMTESGLSAHYRDKHADTHLHICTVCPVSFVSAEELRQHQHIKIRSVNFCEPEDPKRSSCDKPVPKGYIAEHFKHADPRIQCPICGEDIDDYSGLPISLETHLLQHPECPVCHQRCKTIEEHYDGAHPSLKCNSCQMIFLSFRQIQVHYRDVAKCRTCALCSRSFTDQGHFQEHMSPLHTWKCARAACAICGKYYRDKLTLHGHMHAIHRTERSGFMDTDAESGFVQYASFTSLPRTSVPRLVARAPDSKTVSCACNSRCAVCSTESRSIEDHLVKKHHAESPVLCTQCPTGFPSFEDLLQHSRINHPGSALAKLSSEQERPVGLLDGDVLPLRMADTAAPPTLESFSDILATTSFRCMDCAEVFSSEKAFRKHGKKSGHKSWRCGHCQGSGAPGCLSFPKEQELMQHIKTSHFRKPENPWKCPCCSDASRTSSYPTEVGLIAHFKAKHREEVLHSCHLCPKSYSDARALRSHCIDAHGVRDIYWPKCRLCGIYAEDRGDGTPMSLKSHLEQHVKCPICAERCLALSEHYDLHHPDLCSQCGKLFTDSRALRAHSRKHRAASILKAPPLRKGIIITGRHPENPAPHPPSNGGSTSPAVFEEFVLQNTQETGSSEPAPENADLHGFQETTTAHADQVCLLPAAADAAVSAAEGPRTRSPDLDIVHNGRWKALHREYGGTSSASV